MKKDLFDITGMSCSACSSRIQKAVSALSGVVDANVNLLKNNMTVTYDESSLSSADIIATVTRAGYGTTLHGAKRETERDDGTTQELRQMKVQLFISFLFTLPLFYLSMGHMLGLPLPEPLAANAVTYALIQCWLTIPVICVNFKYYRVGVKTLCSGSPNMDSLIALGSGAAAIFGMYTVYRMTLALGIGNMETVRHLAGNLYFESSAMILTLITLGKFFEARAKGKTSDAIAKLMNLAPKTATRIRDGKEQVIPLEEVTVDDILSVKAGENVPTDGVIVKGNGLLDESALTGESLPLEKKDGDSVTGATINTSGHFLMRATHVGANTTLAQIIRLVDEATSSKAPIARLADKISGIFVPIVIVIAMAATVVWLLLGHDFEFALSIGIAVLVISCPCALGLATPTAIMVGTGRGAANGILLKSAEAIEKAGSINTVVLDKTGTVTKGKPTVTDIVTVSGVDTDEVLTCAASLEKLSEHPLGTAIVQEAENHGISPTSVTNFTQIPGQGITGNMNGRFCAVGNAKMLQAQGVENTLSGEGEKLASNGKTPLYCISEAKLIGVIGVADVIKPTSRWAVAELENMGLEVALLTGDNVKTAENIRRQAGIGRVIADVLPQDKEREIRRLQAQGKKVAMVGDGINDAPALARADVGIAIGAGTDIAIESADVVLMKNDLLDAVSAIQLSRAVMRNIKQNLFWAFFYNSIGIPIAAGVFYGVWGVTLNPMIAAAAMSFSSVSVVTNALRLRLFTPKYKFSAEAVPPKDSRREPVLLPATTTTIGSSSMKKVITIEGMSCGHCTNAVEKALRTISGVNNVSVELTSKQAVVESQTAIADEQLKKVITDSGYQVVEIR